MLVEIKQIVGNADPSPNKEALLTEENIRRALNLLYPDEEFTVNIVERES